MQKKSIIKRNILQFLDYKGISKYQFYKDSGITRSVLGKDTGLSEDNIAKFIAKYPEVNIEWLLTGGGKMLKTTERDTLTEIKTNYMKVPFVPVRAQAGFPKGFDEEIYMGELDTILWEIDDTEYKGNYVVFEVNGDSMDDGSYNSLLEGDRILCREIGQHLWNHKLHIHKWNFVLCHPDNGLVVKRIIDHSVDSGKLKCHSLNPYYEDFEVNINELSAIFNVVDIKRSAKI